MVDNVVTFTEAQTILTAVDTTTPALVELAGQTVSTLTAGEAAAHAASVIADAPANAFATLIVNSGLEISADGSITIEHRSADIGLSPPNSGWMTLFGQFFDHGLDLVTKGGNGTVFIPLQADDPLIAGKDHILGNADDLPPQFRFMALTRATPFDANGNPSPTGTESQNTTTPFVDQNQTYTSSASHQVFLREYKVIADGADANTDPDIVNTGRLLNGVHGGIANWKEVKTQAAEKLGLKLSDIDVLDVPQLEVDAYGNFKPGAHGFAQVHLSIQVFAANGRVVGTVPGTDFLMEGTAGGLDLHGVPLAV